MFKEAHKEYIYTVHRVYIKRCRDSAMYKSGGTRLQGNPGKRHSLIKQSTHKVRLSLSDTHHRERFVSSKLRNMRENLQVTWWHWHESYTTIQQRPAVTPWLKYHTNEAQAFAPLRGVGRGRKPRARKRTRARERQKQLNSTLLILVTGPLVMSLWKAESPAYLRTSSCIDQDHPDRMIMKMTASAFFSFLTFVTNKDRLRSVFVSIFTSHTLTAIKKTNFRNCRLSDFIKYLSGSGRARF